MMFRRSLSRAYRTKGIPNKLTLDAHEQALVKSLLGSDIKSTTYKRVPDDEIPTLENIEKNPNLFTTIYTSKGWIAIPESVYLYKWTQEEIKKIFDSNEIINQYSQNLQDHRINIHKPAQNSKIPKSLLQQLVAEWAAQVNLASVPKTEKLTAKDAAKYKADALYRQQLRDDGQGPSPSPTSSRKNKVKKDVNYTHAWNYFLLILYREKGADRKIISQRWKEMNMDQKEHYRQEYMDLLLQGKDVHKGEIILAEQKAAINLLHQKSKNARKQREKERSDKVEDLLREANKKRASSGV